MSRRALMGVVLGAAALMSCTSDDVAVAPAAVTLVPGPLPSAVTLAASTSSASTSSPPTSSGAAPATDAATTTTVKATVTTPAPVITTRNVPCTIERVIADTETSYPGITPTALRCASTWASWIGQPDDAESDGFFAVASWSGSVWELRNLGTAGICEDGGVPRDLWDALGCIE